MIFSFTSTWLALNFEITILGEKIVSFLFFCDPPVASNFALFEQRKFKVLTKFHFFSLSGGRRSNLGTVLEGFQLVTIGNVDWGEDLCMSRRYLRSDKFEQTESCTP